MSVAYKLTPEQREALKLRGKYELARREYLPYVKLTHEDIGFKEGEFHKPLCETLEKVESGDIKRLMVFMPPRHSKSMTITETFPSWFLGRGIKQGEHRRVIEVSYGANLAERFGKRNRDKIKQFCYDLFGMELSKDTNSKTEWSIEGTRSQMLSKGIGGDVTGSGADLLIIDDPIKNRKEANSQTYRDNIWAEWEDTLETRLSPEGRVILIMTRWHEDDLAGRLLEQEGRVEDGGKWHVVNLPLEAEENDWLGRKVGEPLFPELGFGYKFIKEKKEKPRTFASLYQQRPRIEGGDLFKRQWFRYFKQDKQYYILSLPNDEHEKVKRIPKYNCIHFQTIDTAMKTKQRNDYTVISTWALTPEGDLLLVDVYRDKIPIPNQYHTIKSMKNVFTLVKIQAVEDKASGTGLIQRAKKEGSPFKVLTPDADKVTRSFDIGVMYENGMVYHLAGAIWLQDYEKELLGFPNATNDDMVDTASYAGILVSNGGIRKKVILSS